ncbi:TPA: hypothetical protein DEP58_00475 [Patescibacteria group bacterium]|nr:MAG: hypothetical protein UU98_C0026G0019 [Parcubacteria group bacterium GW2011_GWD2_42_14]HCC04763.1 hypothetical protein [Patescibacteria group bacterium]
MNKQKENGVGIVEAIVVISTMSVAFAALLSVSIFFIRSGLYSAEETQAVYLLEEGFEAARFMRDDSFSLRISPLIGAGATYLVPTTSAWVATSSAVVLLEKFSRTLEFSEVYRRSSDGTIVPASSPDPKTLDTGTVRLEGEVSWSTGSIRAVTYLTDLYEN